MLHALQNVLTSNSPWSALFYMLVGVILGAVISIFIFIKAKKPRLLIFGSGGSGNQTHQAWNLSVTNRPTFFCMPFIGETAHDVNAIIKQKDRDALAYPLFWDGQTRLQQVSIESGQSKYIAVFAWSAGTQGYLILDQAGNPVAKFHDRELEFIIQFNDRMGSITKIPMKVKFDDSHLQNVPLLQIILGITMETRLNHMHMASRQFLLALGFRR